MNPMSPYRPSPQGYVPPPAYMAPPANLPPPVPAYLPPPQALSYPPPGMAYPPGPYPPVRPYGRPTSLIGMINGMLMAAATPVAALGGLGVGALIARIAGQSALSGGMWGAIIGGVGICAIMAIDSVPPRMAMLFTGSVGACAGLGFLVGGPVGAIVGTLLASPVACIVGNIVMAQRSDFWD